VKTNINVNPSKNIKLRFLISFLFLIIIFNGSGSESLPRNGVCAHRGASKTHPENTLSAFKEAIRFGAQMIEFDVRMTKDSTLIVIHDDSLGRTTNGFGKIADKNIQNFQEKRYRILKKWWTLCREIYGLIFILKVIRILQ
jgi:hypothetical protein